MGEGVESFDTKVEKYWTPRRYQRELKREQRLGWRVKDSMIHQRWIVVTYVRPRAPSAILKLQLEAEDPAPTSFIGRLLHRLKTA
jgi:hypothetical protein